MILEFCSIITVDKSDCLLEFVLHTIKEMFQKIRRLGSKCHHNSNCLRRIVAISCDLTKAFLAYTTNQMKT